MIVIATLILLKFCILAILVAVYLPDVCIHDV